MATRQVFFELRSSWGAGAGVEAWPSVRGSRAAAARAARLVWNWRRFIEILR
jgi:hypothetical protein